MTRAIPVAMLAALEAGTVRPALFFHGVFATGDLRLWSGLGPIETFRSWRTPAVVRNRVRGSDAVSNNTYWRAGSFVSGGVTFTATPGVDPADGLPVYDFTAVGTPTTAFLVPMWRDPRAFSTIDAAQGQTFTASATFRRLAGSMTGVLGMNLNFEELNASSVNVGGGESAFHSGTSDGFNVNTRTVASAAAVRVIAYPMLRVVVGTPINVSFRIKAFQFEAGAVRTAYQRVDANGVATELIGDVFTGAGSLMGIGTVEETSRIVAAGMAVQLSGVPLELVQACIAEVRQGQAGRVWLGLMDATGALVSDPALLFEGRIDVPELAEGATECAITISYESRLIDLRRPREWRYTDESQQTLYPGDRAFEYVTTIQEREITWGRG